VNNVYLFVPHVTSELPLFLVTLTAVAHCFINYFSWNPAGAIRAGRNPATYRSHGETLHIDGKLSMIIKSGESE
jgi:hypothetical protein